MTYSGKDLKQLQKKHKIQQVRNIKNIWKKIKGKLRRWKMSRRKKFVK